MSRRSREDPGYAVPDELKEYAPNLKIVNGHLNLPASEYNRLSQQYGNTAMWLAAFGLTAHKTEQLSDGTVDVYVREELPGAPAPEEPAGG